MKQLDMGVWLGRSLDAHREDSIDIVTRVVIHKGVNDFDYNDIKLLIWAAFP